VPESTLNLAAVWLVEFLFLFCLWLLFTSSLSPAELLAGAAAAAIGASGDRVVRAKRFVRFRPRSAWLFLFSWQPWYAVTGSAAVIWALIRRLAGRRSKSQFRAVAFPAGGEDPESTARRALAVALTTIPPNFIVVGIDKDNDVMLIHQVSPSATPEIAKRLGAR
jgi:multisubunit Na+/H+ antiporter MnhE subunit